jgi:CheY-like chemotaxis protein/DNA-directed RNA polymerase specialized sigma24 family protein
MTTIPDKEESSVAGNFFFAKVFQEGTRHASASHPKQGNHIMSLSTRIAPHLPYLRRFARAITGSQSSGDAYVAATLEILIADVSLFPQTGSDRASLYKLLIKHFNSVNVRPLELKSEFGWERHAAANLTAIAPKARQAFLLISLEGFSQAETMEILEVTDSELYGLLDEASVGISKQIATDVLIIEDEPLIAMDIEHMVQTLGHRVVGIARTRDEALKIYSATHPSMILADIQLADGSSGIDAVNNILSQDAVPVIFITAFPERLLTGERPEPTFLVTKPFNPDMVKALITQALFFKESSRAKA